MIDWYMVYGWRAETGLLSRPVYSLETTGLVGESGLLSRFLLSLERNSSHHLDFT